MNDTEKRIFKYLNENKVLKVSINEDYPIIKIILDDEQKTEISFDGTGDYIGVYFKGKIISNKKLEKENK